MSPAPGGTCVTGVMMNAPSLDIIIPVWNHPFETRACLVSVAAACEHSRIIVINNGCNRETELLLEEFSDSLGDRAIYMTMERNIGFVPALNHGLRRSEADWAFVMRPSGTIEKTALDALMKAPPATAGILVPVCRGEKLSWNPENFRQAMHIETGDISFAGLAISRKMRDAAGLPDESLDGDAWTLKEYRYRANACGYTIHAVPSAFVTAGEKMIFGSMERRAALEESSRSAITARWGTPRRYCVYASKQTAPQLLKDMLDRLLLSARRGNTVFLMLPRHLVKICRQFGWDMLHTDIRILPLAMFFPEKDAQKQFGKLPAGVQAVIADGTAVFPGIPDAVTFNEVFSQEAI